MKKLKLTRDRILLGFIIILSILLNFGNLGIEGTGNSYYAAAVRSMVMSSKNFFFVSFDPSGFVTIDKPPLGYWIQAISAKIFGFSGWSILLPQALAGVISVVIIFILIKRSFGSAAALISALTLAITPIFVAVSRNNTVDILLVFVLLLACWALSIAAEKGTSKHLILSIVLVGIGFNIKMLQAYMVVPAIYTTYLLSTATSFKKRIIHLASGTVVLVTISLSWALIVDSIPPSNRPYIDSSTNNSVMELIVGHNGLERLSLTSQNGTGGPQDDGDVHGFPGNPPDKGPPMMEPNASMNGGSGNASQGLQGTFGGQTPSSIIRLFSKNILSDQIVWFIPLAIFGFIAASIKERLRFKLDNNKKHSLFLWFMWFAPVFIYFSFNTGTFHSYYLTMLAPPVAALTGIGIISMWDLYKEDTWKSWFLPISLFINGIVQLLMLDYFINTSNIIRLLMIPLVILCFGSSVILSVFYLTRKKTAMVSDVAQEKYMKFKKVFVGLALAGLLLIPLVGSSTVLFNKLNGSFPAAGLELLSKNLSNEPIMNVNQQVDKQNDANSKLVEFLLNNKPPSQKYLLVVSSANEAADIIINTGDSVMAIGGFLGNDKSITLDQFIELVKKGEVRYVMTGGNGGGGRVGNSSSEIMNWVRQNGVAVSANEYNNSSPAFNQNKDNKNSNLINTQSENNTIQDSRTTNGVDRRSFGDFGGRNFSQLYDLKIYTDSATSK